jgi:hypothetical protein
VLLTVFAPFIALIAALLLRGSERDPVRKRQLGRAAVSGAYLAVAMVIAIAIFASFASTVSSLRPDANGACVGGPEIGAPAQPIGDGKYRVPCAGGGSTVVFFGDSGATGSS